MLVNNLSFAFIGINSIKASSLVSVIRIVAKRIN